MIDLILCFRRDALTELGSNYANRGFHVFFCIKNYIGTSLYSEKPLNPPVVYTTDHPMAVAPMLFLFCVAL